VRPAITIFADFSRGWGRALLPPAAALESADVLVIIPHSVLHGVPLHAVEPFGDGRPLATTHGITYAPSGTIFVRCSDRNPVRKFDLSLWEFPRTATGTAPPPPISCRAAAVDVKFQITPEYEAIAKLFLAGFADQWLAPPARIRIKPPPDAEVYCIIGLQHRGAGTRQVMAGEATGTAIGPRREPDGGPRLPGRRVPC
jgi:CHAT domain